MREQMLLANDSNLSVSLGWVGTLLPASHLASASGSPDSPATESNSSDGVRSTLKMTLSKASVSGNRKSQVG